MSESDVFICGGGPAGLATALAARRLGFAVTVADGQRPPIDKACGEGLMPDAVTAAAQLGITIPAEASVPFRGIRFLGRGVTASADFRTGPGLAVRRTVLHQALVDRAEREGVNLLWGTPISSLDRIKARWIIGADGERSRVRTWSALEPPEPPSLRYGFRRHHRVKPWSDYVEVYWGRGLQIYVGPEAPDQVCVTSLASDPHVRVDNALEQFPELRERLEGSEIVSTERGAVTASRSLPSVFRNNIALVGDASGSVDAVTGAGVGLAFQQAIALAGALAGDNLPAYQRAHRQIMRRRRIMADLLLAVDRWPQAGDHARRALSRAPWLFGSLLALHTGPLHADALHTGNRDRHGADRRDSAPPLLRPSVARKKNPIAVPIPIPNINPKTRS